MFLYLVAGATLLAKLDLMPKATKPKPTEKPDAAWLAALEDD
jgi:hypothetical protein